MQPVVASSEYTKPLSPPMNTRPEATVGCPLADSPDGYPNAHFSFNRGTCAAVSLALPDGWNRVFPESAPHPFHAGPLAGLDSVGLLGHRLGMLLASPTFALPSGRPLMNSATRCLWISLKPSVCTFMEPEARES